MFKNGVVTMLTNDYILKEIQNKYSSLVNAINSKNKNTGQRTTLNSLNKFLKNDWKNVNKRFKFFLANNV